MSRPLALRFRGICAALCCSASIVALGTTSSMAADAEVAKDLRDAVTETIETRRDTQQQQDGWQAERQALVGRYRSAQANLAYLEQRATALRERLEALVNRNTELARRIEESDRLEASLQDTLSAVLDRLAYAVEVDLPFLPEERERRLTSLRQELAQPAQPGAEKLRRVCEALQVEAQYGGTIEVYQQRILLDDEPLHVDILRLGRLALFWLTPDGNRVGMWDQGSRAWMELPSRYIHRLRLAFEMATRMRPAGVLELPIGEVSE